MASVVFSRPYLYSETIFFHFVPKTNYMAAQLVEALRYEPEGRGFDFRQYRWKFSLT
jgi:hypothetical protein